MVLNAAEFREIVSGRRRGAVAALARCALAAIEVPYTLAVCWRNYGYDRGHTPTQRVTVPVISVGNLSMGGTGKTPLVAWIAERLQQRGVRVALVSRGYGAKTGEKNDEALELEARLPGVPHLQNPNRVAAAERAITDFNAQVILLDDGFQHRRLARDLDIVLLDAVEPFGHGRVFPRGTLREPISGLRRADVIALSRADMVDAAERTRIQVICERENPNAVWIEMRHAPVCLRSIDGQQAPLAALSGRPVAAFCGIGNPAGFRHTLSICGYHVLGLREFPDHHAFTTAEAQAIADSARQQNAAAVVCTHKDLVKLNGQDFGGMDVWAIEIGLNISVGEAALVESLDHATARTE